MIKAVFLDMDETLCATSLADKKALIAFSEKLKISFPSLDVDLFTENYLKGVYKQLYTDTPELSKLLGDEAKFRQGLIKFLFAQQNIEILDCNAQEWQNFFDQQRMIAFDFFPDVKNMLVDLRKKYQLIVITNGPIFSQRPKLIACGMNESVDHIIIGGEEPHEKPAKSIFSKALSLAECEPFEAIHVGDSLACDIAGANNSGITSVWLDTNKEGDHQLLSEIKPDFIIKNPTELTDVLAQFNS